MSEMVERVTQALFLEPVDLQSPDAWEKLARAAIAAMREPTEAMAVAGGDTSDADDTYDIGQRVARNAWQAMIDEALK